MPKSRIKRGRRERTIAPVNPRQRAMVTCAQCGATQEQRTACRVCHHPLPRDAVIGADGRVVRELDVAHLLAAPTREDALAMLTSSGVDAADAETMLASIERANAGEASTAGEPTT